MKKFIITLSMLIAAFSSAQNKFLSSEYWKTKPSVEVLKSDISAGNNPAEANAGQFDGVTMAINNDAPLESIIYLISQEGNSLKKKTHDGRIYLHWAASKNNAPLVEYLLKKGSDMYAEDTGGRNAFEYGLNGGMQKETMDKFFDAGFPIQYKNDEDANIILLSAAKDDETLSTTNYLISKGVNAKAKDKFGRTIVDYAARSGNEKLINSFINSGYKITNQALIFAAMGYRTVNELSVFKYLIEKTNLDLNTISPEEKNVLHYLSSKDKSENQVKYFVDKGLDVNILDKDGNSALFSAVRNKNIENTRLFISKIENIPSFINLQNNFGQSALMIAAQYSSPETFEFLLKHNANMSLVDKKGNNLLFYIFESYNERRKESINQILEKLNLLKAENFDFNQVDRNGNNILHLVANKNVLDLLQKAYSLNKNINQKNKDGETPLIINAMVAKNTEILKQLVLWGADKSIKNEFNENAFELASANELLKNENLTFLK